MKKLIFTALFLTVTAGYAQENAVQLNKSRFKTIDNSQFDCLYHYTIEGINSKDNEFKDTFNTILQVGATTAKFWDYGMFLADSTEYIAKASAEQITEANNNLIKQVCYYDAEVFQNYPKNKITENGIVGVTYYTYNEPSADLKWTLHSDTLTLLKTLCNKATAEFGGREWTAWYAPSIPVSYGPWKLSGLPGLILRAEENSGMHTFEAISIRNTQLPIYENLSIMRQKSKKEQYLKAKAIQELDPMNIPVEMIKDISISKIGDTPKMYFNGILIRKRDNGYHSLEVVESKESEKSKPKSKNFKAMTVEDIPPITE